MTVLAVQAKVTLLPVVGFFGGRHDARRSKPGVLQSMSSAAPPKNMAILPALNMASKPCSV